MQALVVGRFLNAARVEASRKPTLLYFNFHQERGMCSAWWFQLCNSRSDGHFNVEAQDFQPSSSFPSPKPCENVQLVSLIGCLLFVAFIGRDRRMWMEIVVSNPLTAQFPSLGLPRPLECDVDRNNDLQLLIGVVMDAKTRNYLLVAAGRDEAEEYVTFVYKSSTSMWTNGRCLLPTLAEIEEIDAGHERCVFVASRSVCHSGNLYWKITIFDFEYEPSDYVITFDVKKETWRVFSLPVDLRCVDFSGCWQMTNHEGEICVWHLHEGDRATNNKENYHSTHEVEVHFDKNYARCPQQVERRECKSDLELRLNPEFKWMQHHFEIDTVLSVSSHASTL